MGLKEEVKQLFLPHAHTNGLRRVLALAGGRRLCHGAGFSPDLGTGCLAVHLGISHPKVAPLLDDLWRELPHLRKSELPAMVIALCWLGLFAEREEDGWEVISRWDGGSESDRALILELFATELKARETGPDIFYSLPANNGRALHLNRELAVELAGPQRLIITDAHEIEVALSLRDAAFASVQKPEDVASVRTRTRAQATREARIVTHAT